MSVEHYVLTAEHYVLTAEHYVLTAEHYVQTAEHYVLTAEHYVLTQRHVSEQRNILYISLKVMKFGVQQTALCSICSYDCHYTNEVTVIEQDNSKPISTRFGIGLLSKIFLRITRTNL